MARTERPDDRPSAEHVAECAQRLRATEVSGYATGSVDMSDLHVVLDEFDRRGAELDAARAEVERQARAMAMRDRAIERAFNAVPEDVDAEDDSLAAHIRAALAGQDELRVEVERLRAIERRVEQLAREDGRTATGRAARQILGGDRRD